MDDPLLRATYLKGNHVGRLLTDDGRNRCPRDPCRASGCQELTSGGKPYCLVHIDLMPYVRKIEEQRR